MKLLVIAAVILGGLGVARADETRAYDVLVDHGLERYESKDYDAATAAFAAAYAKSAEPEALFYLAKCHQRRGRFELALVYFDRFLEASAPDDADRDEATRYRAMVARHLARRDVVVPAESSDEPTPTGAVQIVRAPEAPRDDPRAWRQTAWWVSGATIVASYGLAVYAAGQDSPTWDRVQTATQYTWWAGIGGAVYFYYTGFIRDAPSENEGLRVNPAVALDGFGVSLELDF